MKYVLGLGTGRCGTTSLAKLLDAQYGVNVTHERAPAIPWNTDSADYDRAVRWLEAHRKSPAFGDVSHAWISLMPQITDHLAINAVALWRNAEDTVESFCRHMPATYIQTDSLKGALQFPTYDLPEREAWRRYVEEYHMRLRGLASEGHVTILQMDELNHERGQRRILRAAGFPSERHTYLNECHYNRSSAG